MGVYKHNTSLVEGFHIITIWVYLVYMVVQNVRVQKHTTATALKRALV